MKVAVGTGVGLGDSPPVLDEVVLGGRGVAVASCGCGVTCAIARGVGVEADELNIGESAGLVAMGLVGVACAWLVAALVRARIADRVWAVLGVAANGVEVGGSVGWVETAVGISVGTAATCCSPVDS